MVDWIPWSVEILDMDAARLPHEVHDLHIGEEEASSRPREVDAFITEDRRRLGGWLSEQELTKRLF